MPKLMTQPPIGNPWRGYLFLLHLGNPADWNSQGTDDVNEDNDDECLSLNDIIHNRQVLYCIILIIELM